MAGVTGGGILRRPGMIGLAAGDEERGCPSRSMPPDRGGLNFSLSRCFANMDGQTSPLLGLATRCGWDSRGPPKDGMAKQSDGTCQRVSGCDRSGQTGLPAKSFQKMVEIKSLAERL